MNLPSTLHFCKKGWGCNFNRTDVIIWGLLEQRTVEGTSSADPHGGSVMPLRTHSLHTDGQKPFDSQVHSSIKAFLYLSPNVSLAPELCPMAHTAYCWNWRSQHPGAGRHVYCTEQEHIHLVDGMHYQYMKTDTLVHSPTLGGTIALIFLLTSIFCLWFLCVT